MTDHIITPPAAPPPPLLAKAQRIAEMATNYVAEQMGDSGIPWDNLHPQQQGSIVMTVITYLGIQHALAEYDAGLN